MNFEDLEKKLDLKFKDRELLETAFVHRSYLNEKPSFHLPSNERLEFLGDAVLQLAVSEYLFKKFPTEPEGNLTNYRASIVNAKTLSQVSGDLGLGQYLLLSKGEEVSGGRSRPYLLANTFEALLGVIYLDLGLGAAQEFVRKYLLPRLLDIIEQELYKDYKSKLQEIAQEKLSVTPSYRVIKESGPDHAKQFTVGVFLGDKESGRGEGNSKQIAEQSAAKEALETRGLLGRLDAAGEVA
jgi:ribonuclease III